MTNGGSTRALVWCSPDRDLGGGHFHITDQRHPAGPDRVAGGRCGGEGYADPHGSGVQCLHGPDGSFLITDLPVGPYQLEVSKDGFSK